MSGIIRTCHHLLGALEWKAVDFHWNQPFSTVPLRPDCIGITELLSFDYPELA